MPKRRHDEDSDEYIRRKMRKIEKKLHKRKKRSQGSRRISSGSSESRTHLSPALSLPEDGPEVIQASIISNEHQGLPTRDVDLDIIEPQPGPSRQASPGLSTEPLTGLSTEPLPGPSTSVENIPEECTLDDEVLEILGASPNNSKKMGDNIHKDIALRWEHITTSGVTKELRKELIDKHLVPGNCLKLTAPLLNPEVKAAMPNFAIGKDKTAELKQNQLASAISCIGEALTKIVKSEHKDSSVIKSLFEGAQLLCDLQYCESMKRRSHICTLIKKEIKDQLYETEIDTYLFGERLADTLKSAKAIRKSGSEIKVNKTKSVAVRAQTHTLNSKPQLVTSRQPARRKSQPAAYTQAPASFQPRAPQYQALPPPPPPRRPPPPPPLPPHPQQQRAKQRPYQRR